MAKVDAGETMAEDSEDKSATYGVDESSESPSSLGNVKVPEDFQKKATAIVESCDDLACINFLYDEVNTKRTVLQKAYNKENNDDFSKEGMPEM